jgi:aryl-alcohol dehydrogenase-like predicted oxidoreductase
VAFDKGETFSGVDYELGLEAVSRLKTILPADQLTGYALRWILLQETVSCVITGASNQGQIIENAKSVDLSAPDAKTIEAIKAVYNEFIRNPVHYLW